MRSTFRPQVGNTLLLSLFCLLVFLLAMPGDFASADPPRPTSDPILFAQAPPYSTHDAQTAAVPMAVVGTQKTFEPVADAEVKQNNPNTNFGIAPTLGAGFDNYVDNDLIRRALLHFDISTYLTQGTTVNSATLKLYLAGYCDAMSTTYRAYRISQDWSEMVVTWNNQPTWGESYGSKSIPASTPWKYYSIDVTDLVQAWLDGSEPEYGILVRGPEAPSYACAYRDFRSKGGGGYDSAPRLVVDYNAPSPTISTSVTNVTFVHQCDASAPLPAPQTIAINSNKMTLASWSASASADSGWLSLDKTSGQFSHIFDDELVLSIDSEVNACPSISTAQINLTAPGFASKTVNVTLQQFDALYPIFLPQLNKESVSLSALETSTTKVALVISAADYEYLNAPTTFSLYRGAVWGDDLLGPRTDGFEVYAALANSGYEVTYLPEEHATIENIEFALDTYLPRKLNTLAQTKEAVIAFSGHGGPITDSSGDEGPGDSLDELLGVYDTNDTPQFVDYVLDDDFNTSLNKLNVDRLAVVIDACNSGGMELSNSQYAFIAASQEEQNSWETSTLEHGVFTYFMLEAAMTPSSDKNGDGWLSVQEIFDYTNTRVAAYVDPFSPDPQDVFVDIEGSDVNILKMLP
jgi:hypothetical protein